MSLINSIKQTVWEFAQFGKNLKQKGIGLTLKNHAYLTSKVALETFFGMSYILLLKSETSKYKNLTGISIVGMVACSIGCLIIKVIAHNKLSQLYSSHYTDIKASENPLYRADTITQQNLLTLSKNSYFYGSDFANQLIKHNKYDIDKIMSGSTHIKKENFRSL